ncbi:hypothetical protein GCM10011289_30830 [Paludibacterium paludis]|uniref:Toxin CptA n=1 Tax=Paludibacterium paludis TaxID=1225769 RepID=A0A918P689_9NEIS|nr:hypothetical protein GCM10011289_30830 [Paludibacterium paludis]
MLAVSAALALVLPAWASLTLLPLAALAALGADGSGRRRSRPDRLMVSDGRVRLGYGPFEVEGRIEDASVVWSWLIVPVIRLDDRIVRFAVWPDSAPPEARRLLRAYLLWSPRGEEESA